VIGRLAPSALVALTLLTACSPTTYDSAAATTQAPATTATVPTGSFEELLPQMQAEVRGLAEKVASGRGDLDAAARIEEYWAAIRADVQARWPALVEDFEFVVRLCRDAAERNRPANADRASKNLDILVTTILG
jgi:hypothetical protein